MSLSKSGSESTLDDILNTPSETLADLPEIQDPTSNRIESSIPYPGSTFIIKDIGSGHVITLRNGQLGLHAVGGPGNYRWNCLSHDNWLCFQDPGSGLFISYDDSSRFMGFLRCMVSQPDDWEHFCVMPQPQGGFILMMTHWKKILPVGLRLDNGTLKLARIGHDGFKAEPIVWQFIKV
ncbi:hypothetical protein BU24DRAFT_428868 [Aaosphaeria arxii CBS 175.79]|uniref:Ricin B lectin domain-containing protein n=1 Tax=Aaosphaeria arxii CBS 175.79 TaxID=1450172 RepID=A0A6A5X8T7_9PLEO|nr:uncharacterized protein BU24DRAFT_428868 [Aaosphaeria arxii CBS 175.79]KAF2009331.1 hypothetical protein BU24DRAFT_428868 [Aaosphaeria arxii CBS 175.79]